MHQNIPSEGPSEGSEPREPGPQHDATLEPNALAETNLPNRRAFLSRLALDAITVAGTASLLGSPLIDLQEESGEILSEDYTHESKHYPFTNQSIEFDDGLGFTNLGVEHTGSRFIHDREFILDAIKDHDVILLEGCAGQGYFDFMSAMAHHEDKRVIRLESDISLASGLGFSFSPIVRLFTGISNVAHFARRTWRAISEVSDTIADTIPAEADVQKPSSEAIKPLASRSRPLEEPTVRRAAFTWIADYATRIFTGSAPDTGKAWAENRYASSDWSHLIDGRTVLMLGEVHKYLKDNPDESALVITGDMHALGFAHYLKSDENYADYKHKLARYEEIYKPAFNGNAAEELDPTEPRFNLMDLFR
jgi:hypothetical protein